MGGTLTKGDRPAVGTAGHAEDALEITDRTAEAATGKAVDGAADRRARRLAAREFRSRRAPLGLSAALLVFAAGGLAGVEVVSALLGEPARLVPVDRWADALRGTAWQDVPARRVTAVLAALGAVATLYALLPRRYPRMMPMRGSDPLMTAAISRKEVRHSLVASSLAVHGIVRARVRVGGRFRKRVSVRAVTRYRNPANLTDLVHAAVEARLTELDLMDTPPVRVRLRWRKD
jgi:hypothetical protein